MRCHVRAFDERAAAMSHYRFVYTKKQLRAQSENIMREPSLVNKAQSC